MENHAHMVAIYAVWYNRIRVHKTLRVTSAMAAGLSQTVMDWPDVIALMESSHLSGGGVAMGYQYELLSHDLILGTIQNRRCGTADPMGTATRPRPKTHRTCTTTAQLKFSGWRPAPSAEAVLP
jgi:hypothetical protein